MPVIPGFMRLMQENLEFKAILGYIARPYFKNMLFKEQVPIPQQLPN
jgi:hypothetical protein